MPKRERKARARRLRDLGAAGVLTTATYRLEMTFAGAATRSPLRQTALWQRRADGWVMVHEHLSIPLEALEE